MKKNFKCLALMAAALLMGFSSCSNDNDPSDVDAKTPKDMQVRLNIAKPTGTRNAGPALGETKASFVSGDLFLANSSGIIRAHYNIKDGVETKGDNISMADITSTDGVRLKDLPGDALYVYVIGNTPDLADLAKGNISAVLQTALDVQNQGSTTSTDKKLVNNVNLYGTKKAELFKTETVGDTKITVYQAKVNIAPTVARIELGSIKAAAKTKDGKDNDIASFNVEGIFIDYYFAEAPISGAFENNVKNLVTNDDPTHFMNTFAGYPKALYDWYSTPLASDATTNAVTPSEAGYVWGYNVFASNKNDAGSAVPRIVIRLTDVKSKTTHDADYAGTKFITIKGFKDKDGNAINVINPGSIYSLAASLEISQDDITEKPNIERSDVIVTVDVATWKVVSVSPVLN